MCGICGYVLAGGERASPVVVRSMNETLRARGPDQEGIWCGGPAALAMRRLAIVDVAGGRQPVQNETGSVIALCNGELYNHLELRAWLQRRGHRLRSGSDAEVIPHLYEEEGAEFVERLNGMFALAVWDSQRQQLLLARDRMGQKPLYWARLGSGIVFGSEIKALLRHPELVTTLDPAGLLRYLAFEYVPAPWTIFRGVYKLRRGHVLRWHGGDAQIRPYVAAWPEHTGNEPTASDEELAEELWHRLTASVRRRLMSDVPLGAFLSGGIDSAAVIAAMAEVAPQTQLKTFTIGFTDPSYDESAWARTVANHFGTSHHERIFDIDELLRVLPAMAAYLDEPFGDASVLPTHLLSRFAREHVTVCLAGDGGDELLAGYPTFVAEQAARVARRAPAVLRRLCAQAAGLLPVSHANFSTDFVIKQFFRGLDNDTAVTHLWWLGSFRLVDRLKLLTPDLLAELDPALPEREIRHVARTLARGDDPTNQLLALYQDTYLAEDILTKADRASMATSLEVRAPFLDPELVLFLNRLPGRFKLRGRCTKWLLKLALRERLPHAVLQRKKKGFGIPVARWLCEQLRPLAEELLSTDRLRRQGLFNADYVQQLLKLHWARRANYRKQLWTLIMFQLWWEHYGERCGSTTGMDLTDRLGTTRAGCR